MGILAHYQGAFLRGIGLTLVLTAVSFAMALVLGSLLAVMRVSPVTPLRVAASGYVGLMRSIPLLSVVVLFILGLPKVGSIFSIQA